MRAFVGIRQDANRRPYMYMYKEHETTFPINTHTAPKPASTFAAPINC